MHKEPFVERCVGVFPPQVFNGCVVRRRKHEGGRRRLRVSGSAAPTRLLYPGRTGRPGLQVENRGPAHCFVFAPTTNNILLLGSYNEKVTFSAL